MENVFLDFFLQRALEGFWRDRGRSKQIETRDRIKKRTAWDMKVYSLENQTQRHRWDVRSDQYAG